MKILLNITEEIIKPLDNQASKYGMTRTALLQHIILSYLEKIKNDNQEK